MLKKIRATFVFCYPTVGDADARVVFFTLSGDGKCAKILSDGKCSLFSVPFPLDGKGTKRSSRR